MNLEVFSPRDPEEPRVLTVNFIHRLHVGETILSAIWLVEQEDGTAVPEGSMTVGDADCSEHPLVHQLVKGGLHRTTYLHRAKALTSEGRTMVTGALQRVEKGA